MKGEQQAKASISDLRSRHLRRARAGTQSVRVPYRAWRKFQHYHRQNPQVFRLFVKYAREARRSLPRYSADAILHRIRWYVQIETKGSEFKADNYVTAYYARMLAWGDPKRFDEFFELRITPADSDPAIRAQLLKLYKEAGL